MVARLAARGEGVFDMTARYQVRPVGRRIGVRNAATFEAAETFAKRACRKQGGRFEIYSQTLKPATRNAWYDCEFIATVMRDASDCVWTDLTHYGAKIL